MPRVLGILAVLFISIFALDVFEPGRPWTEILIALFMHLIPSFVTGGVLAFAWRFERIGGIAFILIGLAPFILLRGDLANHLIIGGPFFLTGFLFLLNYWNTRRSN